MFRKILLTCVLDGWDHFETTLDSFMGCIIQYFFHWVSHKFISSRFTQKYLMRMGEESHRAQHKRVPLWLTVITIHWTQLSEVWIQWHHHPVLIYQQYHVFVKCLSNMQEKMRYRLQVITVLRFPSGFKPMLFLYPSTPFQAHFWNLNYSSNYSFLADLLLSG